jgi:hypothetical protein
LVWQAAAWLTAVVCFGIVAVAVSQFLHPPKKKPNPQSLYGVAGLFSVGGLVACYVGLRLRGQRYEVFADRLVEWQGGTATAIRWDQVREVYRAVHPAWTKYRIHTSVGRVLTLTGETKHHTRLGDLISERVAALRLPGALEELEAGRSVAFGPLRVSRAGVEVHGELVPWHHVVALTFGLNPNARKGTSMVSNMIHLRITPFCQVELGDIPNYRLFEELVRRLHPACLP